LVCSTFLVAALVAGAEAGSMTMFLTPAVRYSDATFTTTLPIAMTGGRVNNGQPGIYQMDISFTAAPAADELAWANTVFSMVVQNNILGSNFAPDLSLGYSPNNFTLDTNGAAPGGNVTPYAYNGTCGPAPYRTSAPALRQRCRRAIRAIFWDSPHTPSVTLPGSARCLLPGTDLGRQTS
jgi:hypothetical protein